MAQPYLDQLQELVSRLDGDNPDEDVRDRVCKHFFSGAALYLRGSICASLTPVGLAFKLPPDRCLELIAQGQASPLKYFAKSPIKQGYILLPEFRSLSVAEVSEYLRECLEYAVRTCG